MKTFVITTGKGTVWVVMSATQTRALQRFYNRFPGLTVASIVEADGQL